MTAMARALDTTLFVKNGPCMAGLGLGGEGYLSFSIATPTGEGITNPRTFTRVRRCVMVDNLENLLNHKWTRINTKIGTERGSNSSHIRVILCSFCGFNLCS